ncbi:MAG: hypothetical protein CR986_07415 [Ignavibacteriae bacterium]|nr:MAG: hypothetical protein CR986_07415 [Ignavibacteriota bacterium]
MEEGFLLFKVGEKIKTYQMKNVKHIFEIVLVLVIILLFIPIDKESTNWKEFSYEKYNEAIKTNQKMILEFYADWCIPCKELDKKTFTDKSFISASKKFSIFRIDLTNTFSDSIKEISKRFNIKGLPTILIVNSRGEETERITGFIGSEDLIKLLENIK